MNCKPRFFDEGLCCAGALGADVAVAGFGPDGAMPKMTIAPVAASRAACCKALVKPSWSVTIWSAGVTSSAGTLPASRAASAASVSAGVVLQPTDQATAQRAPA